MPLEVELRAVPCLKALINRKNIFGLQEHGSTFTYQTTQLKIPILVHTEPPRYLIIACSVANCNKSTHREIYLLSKYLGNKSPIV